MKKVEQLPTFFEQNPSANKQTFSIPVDYNNRANCSSVWKTLSKKSQESIFWVGIYLPSDRPKPGLEFFDR